MNNHTPEDPEPKHGPGHTSRVDAARHLLRPHTLRDVIALSKQPSLRNSALAGLQAAIAGAIALPLVYLSPWSNLIGFASLGALVALFGRFAPHRSRNRVVVFCALLQTMAVFFMSTASWLGAPNVTLLALLALCCGLFFFINVSGRLGAPGALIFVFAAGASMTPADSFDIVFARTVATGAVAALACLICAATEAFRASDNDERPFPAEPLQPLKDRLIASGRIVVGAAVAISASVALGASHPSWAAMGALAVMQGAHLRIGVHRGLQRMVGTCIGAFLAWLILSLDPSVWTIIAILIALQFATEMIIGVNYGLGQMLVTPMALLMTYLAAPNPVGADLALERVFDTLVGATIGIVLAVLLASTNDRQNLTGSGAPPGKQ